MGTNNIKTNKRVPNYVTYIKIQKLLSFLSYKAYFL